MDGEPDLSHLTAPEPGEQAGADGLRAIVSRARRRAAVAAAGVAALVLVGGGAGGYLLAGVGAGGGGSASVTAAGVAAGSAGGASGSVHGGAAVAPGILPARACAVEVPGPPVPSSAIRSVECRPLGAPYRHLFTRTTGAGVTMRAFTVPCDGCSTPPGHVVEVSTASMVAVSDSPGTAPAGPLAAVTTALGGIAEGDPVAVASAAVSSGVARVSWSVAGVAAGDSMVPVDGFVALAVPLGSVGHQVGTLEAVDANGHVLARRRLNVATPVVTPGRYRPFVPSTTTTTAPSR